MVLGWLFMLIVVVGHSRAKFTNVLNFTIIRHINCIELHTMMLLNKHYLAFLSMVVLLTGRDSMPSIIKSVSKKSLNSVETRSSNDTSSSPLYMYLVFFQMLHKEIYMNTIPLLIFLNSITLSPLETGR